MKMIVDIVIAVIGAVVGAVIGIVIALQLWTLVNNLAKATLFEAQGKYKKVIYYYAAATQVWPLWNTRRKIKKLSRRHGPFEYGDLLEGEDSCSASGHAVTMSIIEEVLNS